MAKADLTAERLRKLLHYDQQTGLFSHRGTAIRPGFSKIGSVNNVGYVYIGIDYNKYAAHRLAWLHVYGSWPGGQIDHIDGNKLNNSLANLRDVSRSTNLHNVFHATKRSKTKCLGVSYDASREKWSATIMMDGKCVFLGRFDNIIDARAIYLATKRSCTHCLR